MMDIFITYQLETLMVCNALALIAVSMSVLRLQRIEIENRMNSGVA